MAIIYLILGVIIGAIITFLLIKNKTTQEVSKANESVAVLRSQLETERKNVDERIATVKENANQQLDAERKQKPRTNYYKKRYVTWLHRCWLRAVKR